MHTRTDILRSLVFLLVLRMIAAPIAARPDLPKPSDHGRFVARVCAWPAQRPQRPASAWIAQTREGGSNRDAGPGRFLRRGALAPNALTRARLSRLARRHGTSVRLSDCPRC